MEMARYTKLHHQKCDIICHLYGNGFKKKRNLRFHQRKVMFILFSLRHYHPKIIIIYPFSSLIFCRCIYVGEVRSRPVEEQFTCVHCKGADLEDHAQQKYQEYKNGNSTKLHHKKM
ncbi:hypothetical protein S83_034352 [Arachis hypogaea]